MTIKVAITGNIASGKSLTEKYLADKGFKVFDTDLIAHKILEDKNEEIIGAFKGYDIAVDGNISRQKLGTIVFSDADLRTRLETLVYPQLVRELQHIFEENKNESIVFIAIPLLFEAEMAYLFDKTIFIYSDDNIRLERLMQRNNLSRHEAELRMSSQMPQDKKKLLSDYVLENNGSADELYVKLGEIVRKINKYKNIQ